MAPPLEAKGKVKSTHYICAWPGRSSPSAWPMRLCRVTRLAPAHRATETSGFSQFTFPRFFQLTFHRPTTRKDGQPSELCLACPSLDANKGPRNASQTRWPLHQGDLEQLVVVDEGTNANEILHCQLKS
ncbi:hypothetical protein E2C01_046748 [Portunus trituberculatus]|uniref:Uncharacterized protein n=1 Tax=Portunus trituberculatus TaxID=210409 RepID=A0A5B7G5M9_PORTR|nr:hypothetical protein [Portunus trituberculatus]